jgi:hypothetical protein
MKKQTLATITLVAITFTVSSCWLFSKKQSNNTIAGKWNIETIADSSANKTHELATALIFTLQKDSLPLGVNFATDSVFHFYNSNKSFDSSKYYVDANANTIFVKQDSTFLPLLIKQQTDTTLQLLLAKDSVWYALKKAK